LNDIEEVAKYLDEKQRTLAVIASGYGPGDDDEERGRKRRKMLMWGAVAVALVAVSYAVVTQYGPAATAPSIDATGEQSSGKIERDLLEANERPNKTVTREEVTNRSRRESPKVYPPISQPQTAEFDITPKGFVETIPLVKETKPQAVMARNSVPNVPKAAVSANRMRSAAKPPAGKIDLNKYPATRGRTSEPVVPGPVRYVKGILLPGAQWAQGVYKDMRHAVADLDPDLVLPGVSLLSRARQAIFGGNKAQFVKESFDGTAERGRHLVRDSLRKLHRFFTNDGRGARALKSARKALADNDAEIVAL